MAGRTIFVDTNVLICATVQSAPFHETAIASLNTWSSQGDTFWISRQVLRECAAVLSRPQMYVQPLAPSVLADVLTQFEVEFHIAEDSAQVTHFLKRLMTSIPIGGKHIHDANIVATMLVQDISTLYTRNTADFQRFSRHITLLPLG